MRVTTIAQSFDQLNQNMARFDAILLIYSGPWVHICILKNCMQTLFFASVKKKGNICIIVGHFRGYSKYYLSKGIFSV